jgi:hypothetical protein
VATLNSVLNLNAQLAASSPSRGGLEASKRTPQIVLNDR